ncbi:pyruvate dehydrogenase complex dihydrolipoamide acetyltransferase component (E2) [Puccinia graminis f. sp. tritici]|uniref:Pyruvate dehydrogenase complex dihydrolipoamide acetyltransferase component (E2) n=1 Tax=Puccinia graminis f. sp. tritici TaxID=56615 RepID=A0A5B0MRE8_PUCGR|nr:pyruvate dehydrogenase complex dihydrolipoamide acetyltransferase component (E2) [Puccinia graminis f. sp. tritici]
MMAGYLMDRFTERERIGALAIMAQGLVQSTKRIALEKEIPLASIKGSGPNGRILASNLASYLKAGGASTASSTSTSGAPYEDLLVSNMRRTIANQLGASNRVDGATFGKVRAGGRLQNCQRCAPLAGTLEARQGRHFPQ